MHTVSIREQAYSSASSPEPPKVGRAPTLLLVSILCVGQFVWTITDEWARLGIAGLTAALAGVLLFNLAFEWLHQKGNLLNRRR